MKRRENGEGTYSVIQNKKTGKVFFRWTICFKSVSGKKCFKNLSAKTKAELKERVKEFQKQREEQKGGFWDNIKFNEWLDKFYDRAKNTVKPKTINYYRWMIDCHLRNASFAGQKLTKITSSMVQEFMLNLQKEKSIRYPDRPLSNATINDIRRVTKIIFEAALKENLIPYNPVNNIKVLKVEPPDPLRISKADIDRLQAAAESQDYIYIDVEKSNKAGRIVYVPKCYQWQEDIGMVYLRHQCALFILFGIRTMARFGEIAGARWQDINFEEGTFTVIQNLQYLKGGPVVSTPKTKSSRRRILLDKGLLARLRQWKQEQEEYAAKLGDAFQNRDGMIFTNSFGKYFDVSNFKKYHWYKLCIASKFPSKRFHDLRHYSATYLLSRGVPIAVVQERGGWSSPNVLMNTYSYVLPGLQKIAVDVIENDKEEQKNVKFTDN